MKLLTLAALAVAATSSMAARTGAPHSLKADTDFGRVTLSWKSPAAPMTLQWHDGKARGADNGVCNDKRHTVTLWASALWAPADLQPWAGQTVTAVSYSLAEDVVEAMVVVYEGNTVVAQLPAPTTAGEHTVELPAALRIAKDTAYRFALRLETGHNATATAVHDGTADARGKGNLLSPDGWTWSAAGGGDFLITARLHNPVDEDPASYRILRDGQPVATTSLTSYTFEGEVTGNHTYTVEALYAGGSTSASVKADITGDADALPDPSQASAAVDGFDVTLTWTADAPCDIVRDGTVVATAVTAGQYADKVTGPGLYRYEITAVQGAKRSRPVEVPVTVGLPAIYSAPFITDVYYDPEYRNVTFMWSGDKPLSTGGEPAGTASFDRQLDMIWGTEYSREALAPFKGKQIKLLRYIVGGVAVGRLSVGIFRKNGESLWQIDMPSHEVELNQFYSIELNNPVTITGDEPLIIGYKATVAAGVPAIVTDGGPYREGGAAVTTDGGATWGTLADLDPAFAGRNICIGAFVADDPAAPADATFPVPTGYNIYRNGTRLYSLNATHYNDMPDGYGDFAYTVTAVYDGGIESAHSNTVLISAPVAQKAAAPYGLDGVYDANGTLNLTWQSPDDALTLGTSTDGAAITAYGEAGGGVLYAINRYPAAAMAPLEGYKIDHIRFALADRVDRCAVIVTAGDNIIYRQDVPQPLVSDGATATYNDVRLNLPVAIPAGKAIGIGYVVSYTAGAKPLALDNGGEDVLLSSTARPGSFASPVSGRLCADAILAAPDVHKQAKTAPRDADNTTYTVYFEGEPIAGDITTPSFAVSNAWNGIYCVTAVRDGAESGYSNTFRLWDPNDPEFPGQSAVTDITADGSSAPVRLYDLTGRPVTNPAPGLYIRRTPTHSATVIINPLSL